MDGDYHQPVLLKEGAGYLLTSEDGVYVDCTLGGAGHSEYFLSRLSPQAFLVGVDADRDAIEFARQRLSGYENVYLRHVFYDQLEIVLFEIDRLPANGVFYDLGVSSWQLDVATRGFSFQQSAELDMRMDQGQSKSALVVLNDYPQERIAELIRDFGEERHWRAIAREIVARRTSAGMKTTADLVAAIEIVVGRRFLNKSCARVFQAIRIEVNDELERLKRSLEAASQVLAEGGRLVVISYHSLEDRIVKNFMRDKQRECICPPGLPQCMCDKVAELKIITRKPVKPEAEEVAANPRARSARMRVAEKIVAYQGAM